MKGKDIPELQMDPGWQILHLDVDMNALMKELPNTKLQGKGLLAHDMYSLVKAFRDSFKPRVTF